MANFNVGAKFNVVKCRSTLFTVTSNIIIQKVKRLVIRLQRYYTLSFFVLVLVGRTNFNLQNFNDFVFIILFAEDFEANFSGNVDDHFRIGIGIAKKAIKLYSEFYSSDIIIASPLGLRTIIGAEGYAKFITVLVLKWCSAQ